MCRGFIGIPVGSRGSCIVLAVARPRVLGGKATAATIIPSMLLVNLGWETLPVLERTVHRAL